MDEKKIILAGGSGFLGTVLANWFSEKGYDVVILSRRGYKLKTGRVVYWDGENIGAWAAELESATALINLAGRSVNCRYNKVNSLQMMNSRVLATRVLAQAVQACSRPPEVWLNSSTATIYKHTFDRPHDELDGEIGATPEAKDAFSVEVAMAWEKEFQRHKTLKTRKIILRTAIVFGRERGSAYQIIRNLAKCGLGGKVWHGRQYVSWIHEEDFCRALEWLISKETAEGIYNVCAPEPITNSEMMKLIRASCCLRFGIPTPLWLLEIATFFMRTESELVIKSRNVVPSRLLSEGFDFRYPEVKKAIAAL